MNKWVIDFNAASIWVKLLRFKVENKIFNFAIRQVSAILTQAPTLIKNWDNTTNGKSALFRKSEKDHIIEMLPAIGYRILTKVRSEFGSE